MYYNETCSQNTYVHAYVCLCALEHARSNACEHEHVLVQYVHKCACKHITCLCCVVSSAVLTSASLSSSPSSSTSSSEMT